jgi:hypothetical protein
MNEITMQGDRRMTTAQVCAVLQCDRTTLMRNWREIETCAGATQVKIIEKGKPTYWTEAELTLLLEKMKGNANNQHDLGSSLEGTETALTPALKLEILYRQIDEIKTAEIARLNADLAATQQLLEYRTAGLATIQRIAEAGGLIMSDRDDLEATYRRGR